MKPKVAAAEELAWRRYHAAIREEFAVIFGGDAETIAAATKRAELAKVLWLEALDQGIAQVMEPVVVPHIPVPMPLPTGVMGNEWEEC